MNSKILFLLLLCCSLAFDDEYFSKPTEGDIALRENDQSDSDIKKWKDGLVRYYIDTNAIWSKEDQDLIREAIESIEAAAKCIKFQDIADDEKNGDYIRISSHGDKFNIGTGCWSYPGRQGGEQVLNLDEHCLEWGLIQHELLHALGQVNEHTRNDRDNFVEIIEKNIKIGKSSRNFQIREKDDGQNQVAETSYDLYSLLRIPRTRVKSETIWLINQIYKDFGKSGNMTATDKIDLNMHYECPDIDTSVLLEYVIEVEDRTNMKIKKLKEDMSMEINNQISSMKKDVLSELRNLKSETSSPTVITTSSASASTTTTHELKIQSKDMLLFLGPDMILHVPSFTLATGCSVPSYPISGLSYAVTGVVDNKIITCGGWSSGLPSPSCSCYMLMGGAWVQHDSLTTATVNSAASMSGDGLLVTGGWDGSIGDGSSFLSSTKVLSGSTWQAGPPLPEAMHGHCQVYIRGTVYIIGGFTNSDYSKRVYSLSGNTWTRLADMKYARYHHSCTQHNENILVIGGAGYLRGLRLKLRSVEMFNTSTNTWSFLTSLPVSMEYGQAGTLSNNLVYAMNENSDTIYTSFDLKTWNKTVISNFNSGERGVYPAPLVPASMINC